MSERKTVHEDERTITQKWIDECTGYTRIVTFVKNWTGACSRCEFFDGCPSSKDKAEDCVMDWWDERNIVE